MMSILLIFITIAILTCIVFWTIKQENEIIVFLSLLFMGILIFGAGILHAWVVKLPLWPFF